MKQKFAILLVLLALGVSQPLALIQASESSDLASSTGNNRQDESPSKEKGSRQNPIPLGEALDYEKKSRGGSKSQLSFTILESWRGQKAESQLQQLAPSYQPNRQPLDDDQELLLLHLKLAYKSGDENHEEFTNAGIINPFFDLICCLYILVMSMMAIWSQLFPKILHLSLVTPRMAYLIEFSSK